MTIDSNNVIVTVTGVLTYPAQPQVVFGSPRRIAAANDHTSEYVYISFDGVTDAVRLSPAAQGYADVEVEFDDFYERIWVRTGPGPVAPVGGAVEVQVVGEAVL